MLTKIVSGGQTGVDRAALDAAIKYNIPHGRWCPKGRLAKDGTIATHYALTETRSSEYSERTKLNIQDSDGTLILVPQNLAEITDGTRLTIDHAKKIHKPHLVINLSENPYYKKICQWIDENEIKTLNIAGPRKSQSPNIDKIAAYFLENLLLQLLKQKNNRHIFHAKM